MTLVRGFKGVFLGFLELWISTFGMVIEMFGFRRECNYCAFICNLFCLKMAQLLVNAQRSPKGLDMSETQKKFFDQNLGLAE